MSESVVKTSVEPIADLQEKILLLKKRIDRQKDLESRLNETLHSLRVHEEELRTQNDDLIAAQKEITQSQRKYLDLFDFAPIGYFLMDTLGVIQEVNLTGAGMIGRHRESINGKPFLLYVESAYRPILDSHLRQIWQGQSASAEVVFKQVNADSLPVELFSIPVRNESGQIVQSRTAATDISKRWQVEKALIESERKLDSIVKTIPDIVYRLDQNGMISFISEGVRRYGYAPDELQGKSMMSLVHPEDRSMARRRIDERRTGVRSTIGVEIRLLPKAKGTRSGSSAAKDASYFLVTAEGLYAGNNQQSGQFIGTQGIAHDITKRKESEIDRIRLETELQKARKMEAIGTLAGGIAHDFNNLLMGIQGCASLMRLDAHEDEQSLKRIEIIEQCVKRGSDLTKQLLGFAKSGKYNVKTIDINKIVNDAVQLFGRTRKSIIIQRQLDEDLWSVEGDLGQLEQVMLNLLINADQAMPAGGQIELVTENIESEMERLGFLELKPGKYIRILVKDTGIGMDDEIRNRIFEPFFTTKEMGHGTGLGLASAYGIIKNHGGAIHVASTPGQGSRFYVYLPATRDPVSEDSKAAIGIEKGYGTILLVDDEEMVLRVNGQMLERLGYQVLIAANGKQAMEIYQEKHKDIDLVILDMIMPGMSGFETYNLIKKINPDLKVLLSSGYSQNDQANEIIAVDQQDFLQKPFSLARLSHKINTILAKRPVRSAP